MVLIVKYYICFAAAIQTIMKLRRAFLIIPFLVWGWGLNSRYAFGQDVDARWAIKPSYSLIQYSGELGSQFFNLNQRSDGGGLAASTFLNPSFDLLMGIDYYRLNLAGNIEGNNYYSRGNIFSPSISFNYKFYNNYLLPDYARFKPYIGAGMGYMVGRTSGVSYDLKGDDFSHFIDEVSFNMLAGVKYDITRKVSVFIELNSVLATTDELDGASLNRRNDRFGGGRVGFFIKVGGEKDSDGDGVPDSKDECPDTPPGVKVDEKGCPLDSDNDGIPDYLDDCPDEPGLPQFNGCPDTDGDGIPDHLDACPDLPGPIELNGCPDSDGDGVIDPFDLCPDTPPGVEVDEYGCPVDTDGDGLPDYLDHCPDEWGPYEYMGCPEPPDVGRLDFEEEPEVYFETDKYELTAEAEEELNKLIKFLVENPMMNIRLYGFADPRGSAEYNKVLSARRVEAVRKYLIRKGIPESRIMVRALGEIQEIHRDESLPLDERYRKARKVQFETFFFMK
jgi:OmpA-OmpF porin, OOP family